MAKSISGSHWRPSSKAWIGVGELTRISTVTSE